MPETKRAVIYARSATIQELSHNFALVEQIHECKEYAASEGYEVVEEFQEVGSGLSIDRQVLKAVLIAAEEGKFDVLITRSFDRLSRNISLVTDVIKALEGHGVKVISTTENAQMGRMILAIFEKVEEVERERIAARVRAGKRAKKLLQEGQ